VRKFGIFSFIFIAFAAILALGAGDFGELKSINEAKNLKEFVFESKDVNLTDMSAAREIATRRACSDDAKFISDGGVVAYTFTRPLQTIRIDKNDCLTYKLTRRAELKEKLNAVKNIQIDENIIIENIKVDDTQITINSRLIDSAKISFSNINKTDREDFAEVLKERSGEDANLHIKDYQSLGFERVNFNYYYNGQKFIDFSVE